MRKTLLTALIAATVALPTMASAQTRELDRGRREVREEQRDLRQAQRHGDRRDVRDARGDLRDARQDQRENWRDYRRDHRAVYARGNWRAPFAYQRFRAGSQLRPAYYSSRYYIADTARYRLPRPGPNAQWVRHYDDVLLVNTRNGRVMEVYNGFFW